MLDSFLTFINQHTPELKTQPTLLTVSGGIDSVVMAHLYYKMGLPAGIAHCNFGLRDEESDGDEAFVKKLASDYRFPFFTKKLDAKSEAQLASISTQMAARELRYQWFEEIRAQHHYQWVATAHHANDSLETLLLNLARGTGLSGVYGIAPVNQNVIRPMILASRADIEQYARDNALTWREDRSNATDDYSRNKIRHHVMPVLQALNPSLEHTFNATSERLRAANLLLNEALQSWSASVISADGDLIRISSGRLLAETEPSYRLWHIVQSYGFSYSQAKEMISSLAGIPGKMFHSGSHSLLIDRDDMLISKAGRSEEQPDITIEKGQQVFKWASLTFSISPAPAGEPIAYNQNTIAVDADKLIFPLSIRKWKQGDTFAPFGMGGRRKKVSDLLIDVKVNLFEKERVGVLVNGDGEIIWVVGIRAAERFRIGESSKNINIIDVRNEL